MATTTDLINAVHDEIVRVLGDVDGASLVQMGWPGISLGPADFRRTDDPQGPVDADVAGETVAALANIVPVFSKVRFENSGRTVDEIYETLLTGAVSDPLDERFTAAREALLQARRACHDDPQRFYHPCTASPGDWYDEAATAGWTAVQLSSSDMQPASVASSPFMAAGGLELARTSAWRLKPIVADNAILRHKLQHAVAGTLGRGGLDIAGVDLLRPNLGIATLAKRLAVKNLVDRHTPMLPSSPGTNGFSISFRMRRVTIDRPWLALELLGADDWWMPGTPGGAYSTGAVASNPGAFAALTTAFVVIRDLKISANWAADDRKHLGNASTFACFDLRSGTVKHAAVEVKGLQVIAWLARVMPRLPPRSPP